MNDRQSIATELPPPELNTGPGGIALTEPHTEPVAPATTLHWYVAALLLLPFSFLGACFALMRSDFLIRHTHNTYLANMGYGLHLRNADCQVLIYGDSSAMVGVDPATITARTGLPACNIAEFAGMTMVNGFLVVDRYLQRNPRPRYLVFVFAPENLAPYPQWQYVGIFEALVARFHEDSIPGLLRFWWQHPTEVTGTLENAARFALTWGSQHPLPQSTFQQRAHLRGRFPDPGKPLTTCPTDTRPHPPNAAWLQALRTRYGTPATAGAPGTTVLIDATPVPACDPLLSTYSNDLAPSRNLIDNTFHTDPIAWYSESGRLHLEPAGIQSLSEEIATQILEKQAGQNSPGNHAQPNPPELSLSQPKTFHHALIPPHADLIPPHEDLPRTPPHKILLRTPKMPPKRFP